MAILDSGSRTQFDSGAVRDIQIGKGRFDLMPIEEVGDVISFEKSYQHQLDNPLYFLSRLSEANENFKYNISCAIYSFCNMAGWDICTAMLETAIHYEEGAIKYGPSNWRLGIPAHSFLDSGIRHYLKWKRGDTDERHDRAFMWNMLGLMWTIQNKPELNDVWTNTDNN